MVPESGCHGKAPGNRTILPPRGFLRARTVAITHRSCSTISPQGIETHFLTHYLIRMSLNVGGGIGGHACVGDDGGAGRGDRGGVAGRGDGATIAGAELGLGAGASASLPARSSRIGPRNFM